MLISRLYISLCEGMRVCMSLFLCSLCTSISIEHIHGVFRTSEPYTQQLGGISSLNHCISYAITLAFSIAFPMSLALSMSSFSNSSSAKPAVLKGVVLKALALLLVCWTVAFWLQFSAADDSSIAQHATNIEEDNRGDEGGRAKLGQGTDKLDEPHLGLDVDVGKINPDQKWGDSPDPSHHLSSSSASGSKETTSTFETTGPALKLQSVKKHTDRVAIIIEDRPTVNLIPLMLHFHSVLGPEWPIILYTVPGTADALQEASAPFSRAVNESRVEIRYLPEDVSFASHRSVSVFLMSPWLWKDLAPFEKILIFQTDSIICSRSTSRVDDFIGWDLIGAPIDRRIGGVGYNGGLSIRNRQLVLDIVESTDFDEETSRRGRGQREMVEEEEVDEHRRQVAG
ncbi:hypothetical protein F4778DRAFT_644739 [Xylariomycetidae sp. FL2044]|nr:hypothetical protein F4778DRAFT_644739 [Xylariomycetidae sp. FL2044]